MEIIDWLSQPFNYNVGLQLYRQHGTNKALLALFELGNTAFSRKKMLDELTEIHKKNTPVTKPIKKYSPSQLPAQLKLEHDKLGDIIREIAHLHGKLTVLETDKKRYEVANKIVLLGEHRRAIFNRIDNFIDTGIDSLQPKETIPLPEDKELKIFRLRKELQLLRANRCKLRDKPHRLADYNILLEKIETLENQIKNA